MRPLPIFVFVLLASLPRPAAAGDVQASGKLVSTALAGPPLQVASSERVDGLNADLLDGFQASDFAASGHQHAGSPYANVLVVSAAGGDFTSIQAAIDDVTDASPTNPYLIWVGPGIYEESVTTKPGIDLRGAGRDLTVIRSPSPGSSSPLVVLVGDGELGSLTVDNRVSAPDGSLTTALGLFVSGDAPRLIDVAIRSTAVCNDPALHFTATGMRALGGASPTLVQVTIEAEIEGSQAAGVCNAEGFAAVSGSTPVFDDFTLIARGTAVSPGSSIAIALSSGTGSLPLVRDSVLLASGAETGNRALQLAGSPGDSTGIRVAHSQVIGDTLGADIVCGGAYDADFVALGTGCT